MSAVMVLAGAMLDARHDDPQLAEEIAAAHFSAVSLMPELAPETRRRAPDLLSELSEPPNPAQRPAIAPLAAFNAVRRQPGAAVRRLADLA